MAKQDNTFLYDKDEKVLCYHGPFIYEAKILKKERRLDETEGQEVNQYFVHYKGWKQTWDEWITEDRVLKYTEANLQKQRQLKESTTKRKPSRASSSTIPSIHDMGESRSRKRNRDSSQDKIKLEEESKRPEFKVTMPESLKGLLVDDWENITKNKQILRIPRSITVDKILEDYTSHRLCDTTDISNLFRKDEILDEFISGLRLYFNKTLGVSLLYRYERKQYEEVCKNRRIEPSTVYGAEHLLRLFVEIPNLLGETNMDVETIIELIAKFEEFLR
ncbi:chromatin modification-related protein EAF3 [Mycotypha africana]|uniref:chromatin modification-related protein EAF3 n=1 Tax=Mycotypha africana TaxID=64632 RepID=UPI0023006581|nr:chromatin modification-related protein EAF3 [Mycotypha africana]KAI8975298.1 chromatin modification-related protein EAF3 [Mycotypha africana]